MPDITSFSASELAGRIAAGEVGPCEVCQAFLDRIEEFDPALNCFLTVDPEQVIEDAKRAETMVASGEPVGPLHGVPIGIKDLEDTRGLRTTFGAAAYADNVPQTDSLLVERLRRAGAIVLGKTNTPAFGLLGETKNRLASDCVNPWNRGYATGGSSGGSAACVAARLAPLASGTDAAGSITGPAAMCGVVGFKPTTGRVPIHPNAGDSLSFLAAGPLSQTVEDAALFLSVVAGYSALDPIALRDPPSDYVAAMREDPGTLRMAFSPDFGQFPVDEDVAALTQDGAGAFRECGWSVETTTTTFPDPWQSYLPIYFSDTRASIGDFMRRHGDELYPETLAEFRGSEELTGADLARAWHDRHVFRAAIDTFFEDFDLLLTPATATAAFPVGELPTDIGGQSVKADWRTFMPFSIAWNLTGRPVASVPCGLTDDGLPAGLLIIGRFGDDVTVLHAAEAFETLRPWPSPPEI
jgi:Asp-tRNA(Asn)/Glu-tRNA(Gln) amidotransferase A subunit family amidase